jgi:alkylation response protein AidB-like acyl-CoA dehydrogenase
MRAKERRGGFEIDGAKLFVADARSADLILVVARIDDGMGCFLLDRDTSGMRIEPLATVDGTRRFDAVVLDGVVAPPESLLGGGAHESSLVGEIVDYARVALAAEMCGIASRALSMSVEYAGVREQFGRPIGSFQAVQHKCADMKVAVENARSLVYYAAWAADESSADRRLAAAMAKSYASEACPRVVADAVQVHGGIGFTWEHDLHLYLKRVQSDRAICGNETDNRRRVASLIGLGD